MIEIFETGMDARFACPCCGKNWIDPRVEMLVKYIRKNTGEAPAVTSGYRCEKHNRAVKGSETSSHLKGLAVDLECKRSRPRYRIIGAALAAGVTRIGIGRDYLHLDIDRQKDSRVIWMY